MRIVNSTARHGTLTTNRLNASEALITKLAVSTDMLIQGDLGVGGVLSASDINTSGTLTVAGTFASPGGYYTNNIQITSDYSVSAADSGQHIELSNPNAYDVTVTLPDMALLSGVVTLYFNVGDLATNNIVLVPSGAGTFQGTVLAGVGGGFSFNADAQMVIDQGFAAEGDTIRLRSNLSRNKWIVDGGTSLIGATHN